jgi:hypothetical protein
MNDELIDNLKKLCADYEDQACELRDKIRKIQDVPKAKSLVGRYFKFPGGLLFGNGRGSWTFKHVTGCYNENVIMDWFQVDRRGKIEISYNCIDYVVNYNNKGAIEITKKEYNKQYQRLVKIIVKHGKRR